MSFTPAPEILIAIFTVGSLFLWGLQERGSRVVAFGLTVPLSAIVIWSLAIRYVELQGYMRFGAFLVLELIFLALIVKSGILARTHTDWWKTGILSLTTTGLSLSLMLTFGILEGIIVPSSLAMFLFYGEVQSALWISGFLVSVGLIKSLRGRV